MPRLARGEYVDPNEVQVFHAVQRCVRRAFLCGEDVVTGKSFEHRRAVGPPTNASYRSVVHNPLPLVAGILLR